MNHPIIRIEFNNPVTHTKELIGISDLNDKVYTLIEKNIDGDCLCIVNDNELVDIDNRDIINITTISENSDTAEEMYLNLLEILLTEYKAEDRIEGYCNGCGSLCVTEAMEQLLKKMHYSNKGEHICTLLQVKLEHEGNSERIVRASNCPLNKL